MTTAFVLSGGGSLGAVQVVHVDHSVHQRRCRVSAVGSTVKTTRTIVVVGASLAGAKAAEGARDAGFDGRIVLIGDEPCVPYERPPLSKAVLRGDAQPSSTRVHEVGFYETNQIELVTGTVVSLDTARREVALDDGTVVAFDAAVLATGAAPRQLSVPGGRLAGVHTLRTVADAAVLREAIRAAARVAIVGAGWIGSEVAASASQMGADVVLIDPAPTPLHRLLGDRLGAVFSALHGEHAVTLRLGQRVTQIQGRERAEGVVLADGTFEPADLVIAGIGVTPRTELATAAGLRVDNGIVVDEHLRTSAANLFAAGDVANAWHPDLGMQLRVEHWANALHQGTTAGRNAAGRNETYDRLPYFFSDQYDLGLEYVGHHRPGDAVVVRGDLDARQFIAFWQRDGVVTAAMSVNVWDVVDDLRTLVAERGAVEAVQLANDEPLELRSRS